MSEDVHGDMLLNADESHDPLMTQFRGFPGVYSDVQSRTLVISIRLDDSKLNDTIDGNFRAQQNL